MLKEIKARLMFWRIKARLRRMKRNPGLYPTVSDELVKAFMGTENASNKEIYSRLLEYWME